MVKQKINRIGEVKLNNYGSKMTIIKYDLEKNITVEFKNGYKVKSSYSTFSKGGIKSPYDKTVYGIGYMGEGKYSTKFNGVRSVQYDIWTDIFSRCYNEKTLKKLPTYIGCSVCEEWHNFQNFAKWYDENYYDIGDGDKMCLDKDILFKGNKVYSPDTCVFVPNRINCLFVKCDRARGEYPIGVSYFKRDDNFRTRCRILDNNKSKSISKHLGYFKTPEEAFYAYKEFKENYIKEVAEEYKNKIPFKLYEAMYEYVVEITD